MKAATSARAARFPAARPARARFVRLAALALAGATTLPAMAQGANERPLRIIVGAPAGGTSDIIARLVGEPLAKALGQPLVVDNKPGALGALATDALFSAPRDGGTWLLAINGLFSEVPHTLKPRYDPLRDVVPAVELAGSGLVLVGAPALPPRSMADLVSWVKAKPGQVSFASYTPGTLSHVLGLMLNRTAGLDMQHVGYKGSPPALQDVIGGQVHLLFDGLATSVPHIRAGKLRAFAVSAPKRSHALPDVPTLAELGYRDMTRTAWLGLWSVPEVPATARDRVRQESLKALALPAVRDRLVATGLEVNTARPPTIDDMQKSLAADYRSMGESLKAVNYRPE